MLLAQISEAGWLVIIGLGLILCLVVFIIAVAFLASRLSPDSDTEVRLKAIEDNLKMVNDALKKEGIKVSPHDRPSPPPFRINRGSA